jgi:hypothetical protein
MQGAGEPRITPPQPILPGGRRNSPLKRASRLLAAGCRLAWLITAVGVAVLLWMAVRTTRRTRREADDREPEALEAVPTRISGKKGRASLA